MTTLKTVSMTNDEFINFQLICRKFRKTFTSITKEGLVLVTACAVFLEQIGF